MGCAGVAESSAYILLITNSYRALTFTPVLSIHNEPIMSNRRFAWLAYLSAVCVSAGVFFGSLRSHDIYFHDDETFRDNVAISQEFYFFFSPEKEQNSGRPVAELVKWIAFSLVENNPGYCHLVVVGFHTLASVLLAQLFRATGFNLTASFLAGFLFLINVSHFQAVYHISALDYPLALIWGVLAVLCNLKYERTYSPGWLAAWYATSVCSVMTHVAMAALGPFFLFMPASRDSGWLRACRARLILVPVIALVTLVMLSRTPESTTTGVSIAHANLQGLSEIFSAFFRMLFWFLSRLSTTAHWILLPLYERHTWELILGGVAFVALLLLVWRRNSLSPWGVWTILFLVPFAMVSETITIFGREGPSHYLYLASPGTSLLLGWLLHHAFVWLRDRWRHPGAILFAVILAAIFWSSYASLKQVEAFSFYNSGRYLRTIDVDKSIDYLQRALVHGKDVLPMDDLYLRLATILLYVGIDPRPLLMEALEEFPKGIWVHCVLAVLDLENTDPQIRAQGQARMARAQTQAAQVNKTHLVNSIVSSTYHNLGTGYAHKGDIHRAIAAYERALEFEPHKEKTISALSNAQVLLGIQLQQQDRLEESYIAYQNALRRTPDHPHARINLAWLLYLQGHWDSAAAEYEALLAHETSSYALYNLGLIYLAQGEISAAEAMYSRAVEEFGASEGNAIGAVEDLLELGERGIQEDNVRQLIARYWPTRSSRVIFH